MRNEVYTNAKQLINEVHEERLASSRTLTGILGDKMGRIIGHAQASVNRGLLAEAMYLTSKGEDDPHTILNDKWQEMVETIGQANSAKLLVAGFFGKSFAGQDKASPVVLPIGDGQMFQAFNDLTELETALRGEPELVKQLINQGRNRLSVGQLVEAANCLTDEQLSQYKSFLAMLGHKQVQNGKTDWIVRVGEKRIAYNSIALSQYEAILAAREGKEVRAADLANGLAGIVAWMVDTALNHEHILNTIPTKNDQGYLSPFWVSGRVDYNPDWEFYPGEEPVQVRFAHFELRTVEGGNKREMVEIVIADAVDSWKEVASWIDTVHEVHNVAAKGERPLTYRLRSGDETEDLDELIAHSRKGILDRQEKKDAEFAAKRAGGEIKEARDAQESWEAAKEGVLNAAQKAQLEKMRKELGYAVEGKSINRH